MYTMMGCLQYCKLFINQYLRWNAIVKCDGQLISRIILMVSSGAMPLVLLIFLQVGLQFDMHFPVNHIGHSITAIQ